MGERVHGGGLWMLRLSDCLIVVMEETYRFGNERSFLDDDECYKGTVQGIDCKFI